MKIHILSPQGFESWDYRNPNGPGIGGSETQVVETSWRLARRGHDVTVYAPIPDDCPPEWRGTRWLKVADADTTAPGIWLIERCPKGADCFHPTPEQRLFHISQDVIYTEACGGAYTEERCAKFERIFALCPAHKDYLASTFPFMADKLALWSNGIKRDEMDAGDVDAPPRDPKRLLWCSSPDRGLKALLQIFKRAREFDAELNLRIAYGFDNWNKVIDAHNEERAKDPALAPCPQEAMRDEILALMEQPGVEWLGRIGQPQLHDEFRQAALWVYPTQFEETSCIACMEAQALGAIPITQPYWAVGANVRHGIFIDGRPYEEPLTRARYLNAILMLTARPEVQEQIRSEMIPWARRAFDWEAQMDKLECYFSGRVPDPRGIVPPQCIFQLAHAEGKVLSLGCGPDHPDFRLRGVTVDLHQTDPVTGVNNPATVIADARGLPSDLTDRFDSVVIGDLLEHMTDDDAVATLRQARRALKSDGPIIITCPEDSRSREAQGIPDEQYADGIPAWHPRTITKAMLFDWLDEADLEAEHYRRISYGFCEGHGVVAYYSYPEICPNCDRRQPPDGQEGSDEFCNWLCRTAHEASEDWQNCIEYPVNAAGPVGISHLTSPRDPFVGSSACVVEMHPAGLPYLSDPGCPSC